MKVLRKKLILTFISIGIIYSCFHLFTISSTLLLLYFCIVMGCACQLVINDDDDDLTEFRACLSVSVWRKCAGVCEHWEVK